MKCPNCGQQVKGTTGNYEKSYRDAMFDIHIHSHNCPANIVTLESGEQICRGDKYAISRHMAGFYKNDAGELVKCGLRN